MSIRIEKTDLASLSVEVLVVEEDTAPASSSVKTVIRVVPPAWVDGKQGESQKLARRYRKGLDAAMKAGLKSIGFPLIAAASPGYPVKKAWASAIRTCLNWMEKHPDHELEVVFAVPDDTLLNMGQEELKHQQTRLQIKKGWNEAASTLKEVINLLQSRTQGRNPTPGTAPSVSSRSGSSDGPDSIPDRLGRLDDEYDNDPFCCPQTEKTLQLVLHLYTLPEQTGAAMVGHAMMNDLYGNRSLLVQVKPLTDLSALSVPSVPGRPMTVLEEGTHFGFRWLDTPETGKCMLACTSRRKIRPEPDTVYIDIRLEDLLSVVCDPEREYSGLILNLDVDGYYIATHSLQDMLDLYHRKR